MNGSEYSPYKSVHHIDRLREIQKCGYCVPVTIHLAPTTYCNCSCYYCYVQEYNKNKAQLEKNALFGFLRDASDAGVKAVEITGGGEPTIYPYFDELVLFCHSIGMDIGVVSNGAHLCVDALKYAKWLRISIDSFDPKEYASIRKTNLPDLTSIKTLSDEYNVVTGASCVITTKNYQSISAFAEHAKKIGFNNVWFKGVEGPDSLPLSLKEHVILQLKDAEATSCDTFHVFVGDLFNRNEIRKKGFSRCMFQHMAMMIYADGDVYYCCSLQGKKQFAFANIYHDSFYDIIRNKPELSVNECPINCFWEKKNSFMEYIICNQPKHVNFM